MGAFFTHVQVQTQDLAGVRDAVVARLAAEGLRPASPGDPVDRRVCLASGGAWVSVYDEGTEDQDEERLRGLLLAMAQVGPAFSTLVHDSDVWVGEVAGGGQVLDRYVSDPNYFGGKRKKRGDPVVRAGVWASTFGVAPASLEGAFGADDLFAEAALGRAGDALGIPNDRVQTGFRYRMESPDPGEVLSFSWIVRPASELRAEGAPQLVSEWAVFGVPDPEVAALEVAEGAALSVSVTAMSTGGPCRGVTLEIQGPDGVVWERADLAVGDPRERAGWHHAVIVGGRAYFPAPIAAGPRVAGPPTSLEARLASQVHVNLHGRAKMAGEGTWRVRMDPDGGEGFGVDRRVRAVRTDDRPLRAPPTVSPIALAPLRDRRRLVALVVLEPAGLTEVGPGVIKLAPWFPTEGKVAVATFFRPAGGPPKTPKTSQTAAAGFFSGKVWAKTLTTPGIAQLDAAWARTPTDAEGPARVALGSGILPQPGAVPALVISLPANDDAERALVAQVDGWASAGWVIQAFVTRWGSAPSPEMTAYEVACGVMGQATLQRPWVERWLRGLGPGHLWLGPALAARIGPIGEAVGPTRRVEVRDVAAAERALAELLPGPEDWRAGVREMYARR